MIVRGVGTRELEISDVKARSLGYEDVVMAAVVGNYSSSTSTIHESIAKAVEKLNVSKQAGFQICLKTEQAQALEAFLFKRDVLAVLPTGFGKSMIFTLFVDDHAWLVS